MPVLVLTDTKTVSEGIVVLRSGFGVSKPQLASCQLSVTGSGSDQVYYRSLISFRPTAGAGLFRTEPEDKLIMQTHMLRSRTVLWSLLE